MKYWLVKSEPGCWSWDDHVKKGVEPWDGVRNHQASNFMKDMASGDRAFFYHSQKEKSVVGILEVVKEAYPDPSDPAGRFVMVDVKAVKPFIKPVSLQHIKDDPRLSEMVLLKQSRLSVMPVDADAWSIICTLGETEE